MVYRPLHKGENKKLEEEFMKKYSCCGNCSKHSSGEHQTFVIPISNYNIPSMPVMLFDFSEALKLAKIGSKISRKGWNSKDVWITVQYPDVNSKMTMPYIYMHTADGQVIPYIPTYEDLLGCDWVVV